LRLVGKHQLQQVEHVGLDLDLPLHVGVRKPHAWVQDGAPEATICVHAELHGRAGAVANLELRAVREHHPQAAALHHLTEARGQRVRAEQARGEGRLRQRQTLRRPPGDVQAECLAGGARRAQAVLVEAVPRPSATEEDAAVGEALEAWKGALRRQRRGVEHRMLQAVARELCAGLDCAFGGV